MPSIDTRRLLSIALWVLFSFAVLMSCDLSYGQTTIHVPGDEPTIQAAINAANNGDMVLVADGTYKETINFLGKAITVTSVNGAATTIIDGGAADTVVKFLAHEGPGSLLNGFTITNGAVNPNPTGPNLSNGGGIVSNGSPKITSNVITHNIGCEGGFGISATGGILIQGNLIANNSQTPNCSGGVGGGGIEVGGPSAGAAIVGNVIANNSAPFGGGITLFASGSPAILIQNNIFAGNNGGSQGGGIWMVNEAPAQIIQNLFIHNKGDEGGAIFTTAGGNGTVLLNNTMVDNPGSEGSGLYGAFFGNAIIQNNLIVGAAGTSAVFCDSGNLPPAGSVIANNIFTTGNSAVDPTCTNNPLGGNGNMSVDPMFVNAASDNYHLQAGSPAIGHGNSTLPVSLPSTDLSGNPRIVNGAIDIGAFQFSSVPSGLSLNTEPGSTASATISAGQSATYHLGVAGAGGFSGTLTLACAGAPQAANCSVSPASLFVNGSAREPFTVTVQTMARGAGFFSSLRLPEGNPWLLIGAALLLLTVMFAWTVSPRRRFRWAAFTCAFAIIAFTGCGGGGGSGAGGSGGTPSGQSTIVVTATSGSSVQMINLTLQVN